MKTLLYIIIIFFILRFAWRLVSTLSSGGDNQRREMRDNPNIRVDKAPDQKSKYDDAEYVDYEEVD